MRVIGSNSHYIGVSTRCAAIWFVATSFAAAAIPSYLVQTIAGSDFIGDGGPANKALLTTVEGVAADAIGNYYLADTDSHRIRRISPKGVITTIAGTGKPGFAGDGGPATQAQMNLPYGLATDLSGNLYVADFGNRCVRKISPAGQISTVAGLSDDTHMAGPRNLAIDTTGNLYISDFLASRIYRLTRQGVFTAYAGSATALAPGDGGPATLAGLKNPAGLAVDLAGNLYISDSGNKRIRKVSGGTISSLAVSVATPIGLALSYANELYVADAGNGLLLRITNLNADKPAVAIWPENCRDVALDYSGNLLLSRGNTVRLFNGSSSSVLAGGRDYSLAGDEAPAVGARLNRPAGLARDPVGNIYIADSGNKRIRTISPDGLMHSFIDGLSAPTAIAIDVSTGNVYIADRHVVLLWKPDGKVYPFAGGTQGFSGDGGPAVKAQLNAPSALAFDPATATVYIADEGNNCVRMVTSDGKIQTLVKLQAPAGLAIDRLGRLFASESGAGRVVLLRPGGLVDSVSNAGLWLNPRGLAVGPDGALYVTDPSAQRITRVDRDGTISLVAGNGTRGFAGDAGPGALASFDTPSAVLVDPSGIVYVADTGNNRIRRLTVSEQGIAAPIAAAQLTIVNAASRLAGPVAAGELVTLLGTGVEGFEIQINSTTVTPLSFKAGEATVALPETLEATVEIQVLSNGIPHARITAAVEAAAAGVFPGLTINNDDGTENSESNPVARGSAITIYGTGEGRAGLPATATLDGQQMDIAMFALSTDTPGMFALVAYVPAGYFTAGVKTLRVSVGASNSQAGVTVYVR